MTGFATILAFFTLLIMLWIHLADIDWVEIIENIMFILLVSAAILGLTFVYTYLGVPL